MPAFQTSPGTRDILPPDSGRMRRMVEVFADLVERAGYGLVVPPMFEDLGVFQRLGEATDVVTKEMYDFVDKGGRHIALRPEQTASVVRAFVQHRPPTPWKVWYAGLELPLREAPARSVPPVRPGRHRGAGRRRPVPRRRGHGARLALLRGARPAPGDPEAQLASANPDERRRYVDALRAHFEANLDALSAESRVTLQKNPLRVLDSKRPQDAELVGAAPRIASFYGDAVAGHFAQVVQAGLRALDIPFTVDDTARARPRLLPAHHVRVRRRHHRFGPERTRRRRPLRRPRRGPRAARRPPASASPSGSTAPCWPATTKAVFGPPDRRRRRVRGRHHRRPARRCVLTEELRAAGLRADRAYENRSMKSQMKAADRSGAPYAVHRRQRRARGRHGDAAADAGRRATSTQTRVHARI